MYRRKFLALGTLGICSMPGCFGLLEDNPDADLWQIGEFAIRTAVTERQTVTVSIRDDDALVYEQELTLPAVDAGHYYEKTVTGYPTDPGLYTVTCVFDGDGEEYQGTLPYTHTPDNQDCYDLYPFAHESETERYVDMVRSICYDE